MEPPTTGPSDTTPLFGQRWDPEPLRRPVEEAYSLDQVSKAMAYLGTGHARGKLVITI